MKIKTALTALLCFVSLLSVSQNYYVYIGTYTQKGSEGIYIYQFNASSGEFRPIGIAKGNANPAFLAISPDDKTLYALAGKKGDSVMAYRINKPTHYLTQLNAQSLGGSSGACHLAVDQTGRWLIVGNYGSGSVTVIQLQPDGKLGFVSQTITHEGKSVRSEEH